MRFLITLCSIGFSSFLIGCSVDKSEPTPEIEEKIADGYHILLDSNRLIQKGWYKDGLAENWHEYLSQDSQLVAEGNFDWGLKTGVWRKYENGVLHAEVRYDSGVVDGLYLQFYPNGYRSEEGKYRAGKREGFWKAFFKNGKPMGEGPYVNGEKEGYWKSYLADGQIGSEGDYENGKRKGYWKLREDSLNYQEGRYMNDSKFGLWMVFENGLLAKEKDYSNDLEIYCKEYKNGKLICEGYIKDDQKNGFWKTYHLETATDSDDPSLKSEGHFAVGERQDFWRFYYLNGSLQKEGQFKNGLETGEWQHFDENGRVSKIESF